MTGPVDRVLLQSYLGDHLGGAVGGSARFARMADAYAQTPLGPALARIARQVADEREWLRETAHALGVRPSAVKRLGIAVTEKVGRLKPNGRLTDTSPLSAVLELDLMRAAVTAKRGLWETLEIWCADLDLDPAEVQRMLDQADDQIATLRRLGTVAREQAFVRHAEPGESAPTVEPVGTLRDTPPLEHE
ncbi:hypothetical protein [Cellulomonas sp. NPDC058312]|uniref:hypothetical protein n=1 Tax=Cellulomonas sp. NPDC058312 TaxID=3346441 RepID=UPI0036E69B91